MKHLFLYTGLLLITIALGSCRDDFDFEPSTGTLEFSQDTVFLDTVFSGISSSTRRFKVYNRSNQDIIIPRVALAQGTNSKYRLAVDGVAGKVFENVELLAKDSLFVFVETTVEIENFSNGDEFLYTDQIEFDSGERMQTVELVTLIKDAILLYPPLDAAGNEIPFTIGIDPEGNPINVRGFVLDDTQLTFTNDKPYVIYGLAVVPNNEVLSVDPGARVHFHANSGIIVSDEASLQMNGLPSTTDELENEIVFEGDRLEPLYEDIPGQWFGLWLTNGSKNNIINHSTIKNASIGIIMDNRNTSSTSATLQINNSQIYNSANIGVLATTADILANNLVVANAGQNTLSIRLGGDYTFNNCTFANYWDNGFRQDPAVFITNGFPNSDLSEPLNTAQFNNCIIYGDRDIEWGLFDTNDTNFNLNLNHSLVKFNDRFNDFDNNPLYDFNDTARYLNNILNSDPTFKNEENNELQIDETSAANGIANPTTATTNDIENNVRSSAPDAGAYESRIIID